MIDEKTYSKRAEIALAITRYSREENTLVDDQLIFRDAAETIDIYTNDREIMRWAWDQTEPADPKGGRWFKRDCQLMCDLAKLDEPAFVSVFKKLLEEGEGRSAYIMVCYSAAKEIQSQDGMALINKYQALIEAIRRR